jgi:tRNA (guanine-N7-)-methyltransferase
MTKKRTFPWEWEWQKPVPIYPEDSEPGVGDILEIGPGRGDLLLALAEKMPDKRFVAIELGKRRFYRLIPRLEKRGLTNVQLLCGDARVIMRKYLREPVFEQAYVLFPDPWPKKRHAYKRLLSTPFLSELTGILRPTAKLYFATDVAWYADWVRENARQLDDLVVSALPPNRESSLFAETMTFFEEKWRSEGRTIHSVLFTKRKNSG